MMTTQLDRIERMLAALCDHLGVHGANAPRTETAKNLASENGHRYIGVVSRFEHGWGFIDCAELGRTCFVHYSDVEGTGLRLLEAGEEVSFELGPGKDGRPKAVRVRRQGTRQTFAEQPEAEAASRQETARGNPGPTEVGGANDGDDDMPQPESSEALPPRSTPRRTTTKRVRLGAFSGRRPAVSW